MSKTPLLRAVALLLAITLAAAACSSSSSDDTTTSGDDAAVSDDATSDDDSTDDDSTDESTNDAFATVPPLDGPVDPEGVRQLTNALTGSETTGEALQCLLTKAEGDSQVTAMFNGAQTEQFQFTPEAYTALAVSIHGCVSAEILTASLLDLASGADEAGQAEFSSCVAEELSAEQTGDLAYTGLSALRVGFPVPEGAQPTTVDAALSCITNENLASQLGGAREQASAFAVEVDRDCLVDGMDDAFVQSFWNGAIGGDDPSAELEPLISSCTQDFDSGLPKEVPADFVPFAGDGALAAIDPSARNGIYSAAPPMSLEDGVDYQAVITTPDGEILLDLFEDTAPITVNSFVSLAQDGFFDGTRFHRVFDGFMAQAGDPLSTGSGGAGYSFDDEETGLVAIDRRGLLAMANSGPNSNGSQFFITLDAADWLDGLHTVFGEVLEGDDVLASIELRDPAAPTSRGEELISITIVEA